jgi:hypothetical protein
MAIRRLGWFGSDALDFVVSAAGSAVSSAGSVLSHVPGSEVLAGAIDDAWTGPLGDFARSPVGGILILGLANTLYTPLGYALGGPYGISNFGAQIASVVWALPGMVRGEDFWTAWFDEVKLRAEKTAELAAPGAVESISGALLPGAAAYVSSLAPEELAALEALPDGALPGVLSELAARAGVDEWSIAMVMAKVTDRFPPPPDWGGLFAFDLSTGALLFRSAFSGTVALPSYAREAMQLIPIDRGILARPAYAALAAQLTGSRPLDPAAFGLTSPISVASPASDARKRQGDVILFVVVAAAAGALYYWRKELAR